jgi:WhiB family transcriptional regulator, redox-sensing transcriptional regulator
VSALGWQDFAACRGESVDLFFGTDRERPPERDVRERKAKAICESCPVVRSCLDWSIGAVPGNGKSGLKEPDGIWGGLSKDERYAERRRRTRRAAQASEAKVA